jgi:hypothetical protein
MRYVLPDQGIESFFAVGGLVVNPVQKGVGRPAAKEVGMGNPAEETTGHPTIATVNKIRRKMSSGFERFFSRSFSRLR